MAKGHGGVRPNSGRKPKADEIAMIERMDAIMAPDKAWMALAGKAMEGDTNALKAWLAYRYGQPKETIKNDVNINEFRNWEIVPASKAKKS